MKEEVILKLVQIQTQFRFMHWQTTFDAKHKAYGMVYESLDGFIDDFVEAMMGKYGRPEFTESFSIMFQDLESLSLQHFIDGVCEFLMSLTEQLDSQTMILCCLCSRWQIILLSQHLNRLILHL